MAGDVRVVGLRALASQDGALGELWNATLANLGGEGNVSTLLAITKILSW